MIVSLDFNISKYRVTSVLDIHAVYGEVTYSFVKGSKFFAQESLIYFFSDLLCDIAEEIEMIQVGSNSARTRKFRVPYEVDWMEFRKKNNRSVVIFSDDLKVEYAVSFDEFAEAVFEVASKFMTELERLDVGSKENFLKKFVPPSLHNKL